MLIRCIPNITLRVGIVVYFTGIGVTNRLTWKRAGRSPIPASSMSCFRAEKKVARAMEKIME